MGRYLALRVEGPLALVTVGLWVELRERGYSPARVRARMRLMLELSRWLADDGLGLSDLNAGVVEHLVARAVVAGPVHRGMRWFSPFSERDVLAYLRELGLVEPVVVAVPTQVDLLIARFREYLARERGIANSTSVYWYERIARSFLAGRVDPDSGAVVLTAGEVTGFLLTECWYCSRWMGMRLVTSLGGLLRFLLVEGLVGEDLTGAVPRLPRWSLAALPKALPAGHAARIVGTCDRSTRTGRRDFAILMLLSRMGLRGCEIARLVLEDLDWRAGEVIVRGERVSVERLPLPVDVGEALVDYLAHGRPPVADRHVFLTAIRPFVPLNVENQMVGAIVLRASERAGLGRVGVHRLRHTVATEALRAGAPLEEIASLLRHRDWVTTMGYAKVDWDRLRELARPWPAGARS